MSVTGVLCFGFHGDGGLAHVVCLSGLAATGHRKSVYPVQKCLQSGSAVTDCRTLSGPEEEKRRPGETAREKK